MKKQSTPIIQTRVSTRSADAERRAAVANRELLRWDVAREKAPRLPRLAQEWADDDFAAHQAAQREALRVMDVIDAMRPAHTVPDVRALHIEEHPQQPMDAVVEEIRLQPPRLHRIARQAGPWLYGFGLILFLLAGMAIGKTL